MNLDSLINEFRGPLIGLFAAWSCSPLEAQELAQDVFAEAFLSKQRFRGNIENPTEIGAWLRGIARNLYREHVREKIKQREKQGLESVELLHEDSSQEPNPILEEIKKLRQEYREVLCMHYLEETSVREVAALLDVSEKTVESRLFRARIELKERLGRLS